MMRSSTGIYHAVAAMCTLLLLLEVIPTCDCKMTWAITDVEGGYTNVGRIGLYIIKGSLSQCAVECYMVTTCTYFGYATRSGHCVLHDVTFAQATQSLHASAIYLQYYIVTCGQTAEDEGWLIARGLGVCVKPFDYEMEFDAATNTCLAINSHLPYITTQAALDFYYDLSDAYLTTGRNKFWVGGYRETTNSSVWLWQSGEVISDSNGGQLWINKAERRTENFMIYKKRSKTDAYGFLDSAANGTYPLFCERPSE